VDLVSGAVAGPAADERTHALLTASGRRRLLTTALPGLLLALGALLRLRQWAAGRSFWLDELFIVEQVTTRGFGRLAAEPLSDNQSAPVGWLWSERLAYHLLGDNELALRLPSLVFGIAALVLVWRLALRVLPGALVGVPVAFAALAPALIRYSNEVKQYQLDVVMVLLVLLVALRVPRDRFAWRPVAALAGLGVAAVWCSVASVFALGAVSLVLVVDSLHRREVRRALLTAGVLSAWLVSLGVAYLTVLTSSRESTVLNDYWAFTFPEGRPVLSWAHARFSGLLGNPLHLDAHSGVAGALLVLGAVALVLRSPRGGAAVLVSLGLGAVAALGAFYPFADRLALWTVPLAGLLLAALLPHTIGSGPGMSRAWLIGSAVALLVVTGPACADAVKQLGHRVEVEEMERLLHRVERARQPGDTVLSAIQATTAMAYYGPRTGVVAQGVVRPRRVPAGELCRDASALQAAGFTRHGVWVVVRIGTTEYLPNGPLRALRPRIGSVAREVQRLDEPGVYAVRFVPAPGTARPHPSFCLEFQP
jgi:hypothetical protein